MKNQFSVGDTLILHSPFTGEDTRVNYRGECGGGKAVVIPLPKGLQFAVPVEWLRRDDSQPEEARDE
jgi:hypothetical protein